MKIKKNLPGKPIGSLNNHNSHHFRNKLNSGKPQKRKDTVIDRVFSFEEYKRKPWNYEAFEGLEKSPFYQQSEIR